MIPTLDKVALESAGSLALKTGFDLGWAPGTATYLVGKGVEGWTGSTPIRRSKAELLGGHGTHAERGWKDERLITVTGHHVAASRAAAGLYADDLAAFLGDGEEGVFRVDDASLGSRWAEVYLATSGVDVTWTGGVDVAFQIMMVAPDPRKYGDPVTSAETGIPVPGSGLVFPLFGAPTDGVLNIGSGGYLGRASVTNTGTADTGPVFTIWGDYVPGFTITDIATGRRLVYTETITTGQTLVLDANDGSVTLDGYAPRDSKLVVSDWTRLGRGETGTWQFESPGSTNAKMTVGVTPAWW